MTDKAKPIKPDDRDNDARLQEFFELCKHMYERMELEGTWPWPVDSTNPDDMVDSEDPSKDL